MTGERQAARIRGLYLKTILRQDVAFFDKETNTGEVVGRMSGDTVLIQDAMGEKVFHFTIIHPSSYSYIIFSSPFSQLRIEHQEIVLQVGKTVQLITTFIGGFTIAFLRGWLLTLVMLSAIPLLVLAGATIARFMSQMAARGQSAYSNAANVVEQTIGSIRTVGI